MPRYCVYMTFPPDPCKLRPYMSLELLVLATIVIDIYAVTLQCLANPKATRLPTCFLMLSFRLFVTTISEHLGGMGRRQRFVMWAVDWKGCASGATAFSGLINAVRVEYSRLGYPPRLDCPRICIGFRMSFVSATISWLLHTLTRLLFSCI